MAIRHRTSGRRAALSRSGKQARRLRDECIREEFIMRGLLAGLWLSAALPMFAGMPNLTGHWKLNETATQGAAHRGTIYVIEHNEPKFKYSASGNAGYAGRFQ